MSIFSNSDKYKYSDNLIDPNELDIIDLSKELHTSLGIEDSLFDRFSKDEVLEMMEESHLFNILRMRGYKDFFVELQALSVMDNRILVKTKSGQTLIHIRLKFTDFQFARIPGESFRMVYIDWLLTQNVKRGKLKTKKGLFRGQEYPGLNVIAEITNFITIVTSKLGAHGVFNIPEYFHDAVLFHKSFLFLDPVKEGFFRALLQEFKHKNLKSLSNAIHNGKIVLLESNTPYEWKYGEMLHCISEYLQSKLFDEVYFSTMDETRSKTKFEWID